MNEFLDWAESQNIDYREAWDVEEITLDAAKIAEIGMSEENWEKFEQYRLAAANDILLEESLKENDD